MRITVVVNPTAGSGTARSTVDRTIARLRERGAVVAMRLGDRRADTVTALLRAREERPDLVAVIGGDGTARLAVEALHGTRIPVAVVPVGTGNDLAAAFAIPRDPVAAADVMLDGRDVDVDVARACGADGTTRPFATVFASGFDSKVNEQANRMRRPQGRARYNIAIAIEFALLTPIPYRVTWIDADGAPAAYEGPLLLTAVGNTARYGGGIPICPAADASDGLLDLTLVRPAPRRRLVRVLTRAFRGDHVHEPEVSTHRVRAVRLEAQGLTGYADGDPMGPLPTSIDVLPRALTLRVPA